MTEPRRGTILLVDDVVSNIRVLNNALKDEYEVCAVLNGESALDHIRSDPPDIILLDVSMPGTDGFEVCRRVKSDPATAAIPVVFLTARTSTEDKAKGFDAGAVDYVTKPFDISEVRARIRTHLELRRSHEELIAVNTRLKEEISKHRQTETELQDARDDLERRVEIRAEELMRSNEQLRCEIEEHRHTLASLRASEERYRLLTENVADGVCIIRNRKLVFVNAAFVTMFAYPLEQLLGKNPLFLIRSDYQPSFEDILSKTGEDEGVKDFQIPCVCQDGREIWTEGHYHLIEWEHQPAVLGTLRDITRRKSREMAIAKEKDALLREIAGLRASVGDCYRFGDIVGKSPAMQHIYQVIADASASDDDVIIYGESGTGKELIARTIHHLSRRQNKTFLPVNCGAIPESLFEREFFGHRKGAFTSADADKPGFFDLANGGTLFLDEVGELTPVMQVKLLRAVEGGGYTPVGDNKVRKTDVRIISATNQDLMDALKDGNLREDFFYRIHVIPVRVPPLRKRKEDIPLLTDHFLKINGSEAEFRSLPGKMLETLHSHNWPGNVRELQNVLKRYLTLNSLDFVITSDKEETTVSYEWLFRDGVLFHDARTEFEKEFISKALARSNGNRSKAASLLGLNERTLYRKMKLCGLTRRGSDV